MRETTHATKQKERYGVIVMIRIYKNAKIVTPDRILKNFLVVCRDGTIEEIAARTDVKADEAVDCNGLYLSPGFADIHVHGGGGFSAMGSTDEIVNMCRAHAVYGTTSILPTTLAAPIKQLRQCISNITDAKAKCTDSNILGVHLEGPFISMKMRGAQSPENILLPTDENIDALLNFSNEIRMIGAAPELPNAFKLGEEASKKGIVASVAHTDASFETAEEAFNHGFSDITHIWSACSAMHKEGIFRKVGAVEAALANGNVTAQFIGDLRHLPAGAVKLLYAVKGAKKAYAISDGLEYSACDVKEGTEIKQKNGLSVILEDSVMKLADRSCLAGSVATVSTEVRNLVKTVGIPLTDAVTTASHTPLSVIGFGSKKGLIKHGFDEDIILFDNDINVKYVTVKGKTVVPLINS